MIIKDLYKLNKIITLHFHAETVNDNLPLLVYPSEETLDRQIDLLDAWEKYVIDNRLLQPFP